MPLASLLEDGSYIEMEFKGEDGQSITLGFQFGQFKTFMSMAHQLVHEAEIRKAARAGHLEVQPLAVVASGAQEAVGGAAVIAFFRTDNGQIYHFALAPGEATILQNQLVGAVTKPRKQAKQTGQ